MNQKKIVITQKQILEMEASQEMDLLIDTTVLHLSVDDWNSRYFAGRTKYSSDIACAWEVLEKINAPTELFARDGRAEKYGCKITLGKKVFYAHAITMPLAICRVALLASLQTP
jgi:hypothetical protein